MGYFGRLGHKLSGIGHRLGQKVSAARTGFKRYGGKIAAVAKLIAPFLTGRARLVGGGYFFNYNN